jgi:hypothetical protein
VGESRLRCSPCIARLLTWAKSSDWGVTRDQNGVEVAGLLYGQRVALNFVDHGQQFELIAAAYGAKVSLDSAASGVLQEMLSRCHG